MIELRAFTRKAKSEKIYILRIINAFMTLDDFFKECEKNGGMPLSYRSHTETLKGTRTIEYENPKYAEAKARLAKMLGRIKQTGNPNTDNLLARLYGEEVVIHTKDGYHYGTLHGYDGRGFMLGDYYFDKKLIDDFDYAQKALFSSDSVIPAENIISISEIPLKAE